MLASRSLSTVLLYVIVGLFIVEDVLAIGVNAEEFQRYYIYGVPARDVGLGMALSVLVVRGAQIRKYIDTWRVVLLTALTAPYVVLGVWNYGISNQLNGDVRKALWFYGGIGVALLLMTTSCPKRHLRVLLAAFTILMALASVLSEQFVRYIQLGGVARVEHPSVYIFSCWVAGLTVLLSYISRRKTFPLVCLGAFAAFSAVLTGTRSQVVVAIAVLILVLRSVGLTNIRRARRVKIQSARKKLGIVVLAAGAVCYMVARLDDSRFTRFATITHVDALVSDPRADEVRTFVSTSSTTQLLVGRGFGGTVPSPIYQGDATTWMHIGIMNIWLKLGLVPFLATSIYVFCVVPLRHLKSVRRIRRANGNCSNRDLARALIVPALFPWMVWALLSGGYTEQSFLFLGWIYFMYSAVGRFGLSLWIKVPRPHGRAVTLRGREFQPGRRLLSSRAVT